jgi:hypothetical protein
MCRIKAALRGGLFAFWAREEGGEEKSESRIVHGDAPLTRHPKEIKPFVEF